MNKKTIAFLKIFAAFFIWSLFGPILNLSSFTAMQNSFWTSTLTAFYLLSYFLFKAKLKEFKKIKLNFSLLFFILSSGLVGILWFNALTLLPVAQALLLMSTITIFSMILGYFILKENIYITKLIAIALGIGGITIILSSNLGKSSISNTFLLGAVITLLAAFFGALQVVIARKFSFHYSNALIALLCTLPQIIIAAPFAFKQAWVITPFAIGGVIFLSIFTGIIAFFFYVDGLRVFHSSSVRLIGYVEIFLASIWGYIFLRQTISLQTFLGGIIILFAGYLIVRSEKNASKQKA